MSKATFDDGEISVAPSGEGYCVPNHGDEEAHRLTRIINPDRETVVVQGIGFVGSAMLAALARARNDSGHPLYNVIGVDRADARNYWKIGRINEGLVPVDSSDDRLREAISTGVQEKNLTGTFHPAAYGLADIVVVDIHLDVKKESENLDQSSVDLSHFEAALREVAERIREDGLLVIETTVPPGTTEKVVAPLFQEIFIRRGLDFKKFHIAHAPERVMPGPRYLESIAEFHRVFAGINPASARRARRFLESFIDTARFPLTELGSTTASETTKVLENAYRAANIAFIQEWTELAHRAGIDLFESIDAIRMRPTHANIRQPGVGVGGYCLTKDALFANWAGREFFGSPESMPLCLAAIGINDRMPQFSCRLIEESVPALENRTALLLGVSYLSDVADTRHSPSELIYDFCQEKFSAVVVHDPFVAHWPERNRSVERNLEKLPLSEVDTLIFLVGHSPYTSMNPQRWMQLCPGVRWVIDTNRVISPTWKKEFENAGVQVTGTGRGNWRTQQQTSIL